MSSNEQQMWGIHGGRTGDANTLFLQENCIALGWHKIGDLSKLAPTREAFKAELASKFPEKKAGAIPVEAGQLFRFVHEVEIDDIVIYPSKADRHIHIARISGNYTYNAKGEITYLPPQNRLSHPTVVDETLTSAMFKGPRSPGANIVNAEVDERRRARAMSTVPPPEGLHSQAF